MGYKKSSSLVCPICCFTVSLTIRSDHICRCFNPFVLTDSSLCIRGWFSPKTTTTTTTTTTTNKQTNKGTSYVITRADLIEGQFSAANPGLVTTTSQLLWFQLTKTENDSFSLELTDRAPNNSAQGPVSRKSR